jgi:putative FmdB family regulatory protein
MPTYEYICKKCNNQFEAFQSIKAEPITKCPECGGIVERKIFGGAGLHFKGSGFYITDYKKSSSSTSSKNESKKTTKKAS